MNIAWCYFVPNLHIYVCESDVHGSGSLPMVINLSCQPDERYSPLGDRPLSMLVGGYFLLLSVALFPGWGPELHIVEPELSSSLHLSFPAS